MNLDGVAFRLQCGVNQSVRFLRVVSVIGALTLSVAALSGQVQTGNRVNKANWKLANRFTSESLRPYLYSSTLYPSWINKTSDFWYAWRDDTGLKYWRVDAKAKKKTPLFDSAKMAALLSEVSKKPYDTTNLPSLALEFDAKNADLVRFNLEGKRYEYDLKKVTLKSLGAASTNANQPPPPGGRGRRGGFSGPPPGGGAPGGFKNMAPDKKGYVYAMGHNLYYVEVMIGKDPKDTKEGDPIQLTKDGEKDYSFGNRDVEAGAQDQEKRVRAFVTWSKDSKRFFVNRNDTRRIKELYLVNNLAVPRPTLKSYKYEMPGEAEVTQTETFVFNREKKELTKLPIKKYKDQDTFSIHWQDSSSDFIRFIRRDRLQRNLEYCEYNLMNLTTKVLVAESIENAALEFPDARYVKPGGDFIWYSERTGWGHYYLYSNDGKLKNAITSGPYHALSILDIDADKGLMWIRGCGREAGEDANYEHVYRTKLDGTELTLLDPGDANHSSRLSPDKKFVVDIYSRMDLEPHAVLRDDNGKALLELEKMDLSRLEAMGWKMPERFTVKAADGVTNIYGNIWKPIDLDPNKKYPIIAYVYPGPQTEAVNPGFSATDGCQRLAQLGFIVVQIGNRGGTPSRSTAYHRFGYYNLRDYGLADKKIGIEQLAARYPYIDIDRVGIYGHSGGGFMTAAALLLPPYNDFFKVGVSSSGNHDNNIYNSGWSENNHGLKEVPLKDMNGKDTGLTKFEIKVPTNIELAANLKGNLLLVTGDMDDNVHPANTIRLVNALIRANKRFDFMIMPGQAHGYGDLTNYFNQLTLEYFAEHLLGDYYKDNADIKP
jgi:dienelactone hydrolase